MTTAESTWYFDITGRFARADVRNGMVRWSLLGDIGETFPALRALGVRGQRDVGAVVAGIQTGRNEVILDARAARWWKPYETVERLDIDRSVRLDLTTGNVVEFPVTSRAAIYDDGVRRYEIHGSWEIVDAVTGETLEQHMWGDSIFQVPFDGTVAFPFALILGVIQGRLYLRLHPSAYHGAASPWSYRIFDLNNLTTDGIPHGDPDPDPPAPPGFIRAWSMLTDPDTWHARYPGGQFTRDMLEAINTAALQVGTRAIALLAVMNAESGLRTTAFHPVGRYGLIQLSADQLSAAGWAGTPDEFLDAGVAQIPIIQTHLAGLAIPPDASDTLLWICTLLPANERPDLDGSGALDTVVASPNGPHRELWGSHGVADVNGDGKLTVGDLDTYLRQRSNDRKLAHLNARINGFAAVIPDWPTLTEVNEGDDMGIVRPSAAQLGLTVEIIARQQEAGFDHEQVVSIDPPAGTLASLGDPVRVTVNFQG